jgi:hypothetical protein
MIGTGTRTAVSPFWPVARPASGLHTLTRNLSLPFTKTGNLLHSNNFFGPETDQGQLYQ